MCVIFTNKHGSTTRVIACVLFSTNHTWIHQWSLHVCSFHKPHMDQPLVIACVIFPLTTYGSTTRVIACLFFSQTTHGSTTRVIACVLFPQTDMDEPLESLHVCTFPQTTQGSTRVIECV